MTVKQFESERKFNAWLQGPGESLLLRELELFFGATFRRIKAESTIFGIPDNVFYAELQELLIIVESTEDLNKRHLFKDLVYSLHDFNGIKINSMAILWIVRKIPSAKIVKIISTAFGKISIDNCQLQFHIATVTSLDDSMLRLNLDYSYGARTQKINGQNFKMTCSGTHKYLSIKSAAAAMGVPYTTFFNLMRRWGSGYSGRMIPVNTILDIIKSVEKTASRDTAIRHYEFLSENAEDPRKRICEELVAALNDSGSVICWNASFEKSVLSGLAERFPQYGEKIKAIISRITDLIIPFRSSMYVDWRFEGSASLKKVLPIIAPGLTYDDMVVNKGDMASLTYQLYIEGQTSAEEWAKMRGNMVAYCSQDTKGMAVLHEFLRAIQ